MSTTQCALYPPHSGDLIIETSDGVLFGVHILLLRLSSSVMSDMLTVGSGSGDTDKGGIARLGPLRVHSLISLRISHHHGGLDHISSSPLVHLPRQNTYSVHEPYLLDTSSGRRCQVRHERRLTVVVSSAHERHYGRYVDIRGPSLGLL